MDKGKIPSALERDLPEYKIESVLGSGATSTVYRAVQISLGRFVAIKRFDPSTFLPKSISERFEREAAIWSHLSHENLIHLYDYRLTESARYIILEYCHGIELREVTERIIALPPTVVAATAYQVLCALEYLHLYSIVHRDLKPANIFLTSLGVIKVMDFGISLCPELEPITGPGQVIGTPAYMSPEQATGKGVDKRSDFFSLGAVLYELLEGVKPFNATSLEQMSQDPNYWKFKKLSRSYPSVLRTMIHTCLEKKPQKRKMVIPKQKQWLEKYLQKNRIRDPREHIQGFLHERRLVSKVHSLFWIDAIKETTDGPLGTTFSQLLPLARARREQRTTRAWLLTALLFSILIGLHMGPPYLRPDWKTFGSFLIELIQKAL